MLAGMITPPKRLNLGLVWPIPRTEKQTVNSKILEPMTLAKPDLRHQHARFLVICRSGTNRLSAENPYFYEIFSVQEIKNKFDLPRHRTNKPQGKREKYKKKKKAFVSCNNQHKSLDDPF